MSIATEIGKVSEACSLKHVTRHICTVMDLFSDQAADVAFEYLEIFGPEGIKALHAAIVYGSVRDVRHDIAERNKKFMQPRTLDWWKAIS